MPGIDRKIPDKYLDEFLTQQTVFIKSRVHLFCLLTIAIYFFASLMGLIINPDTFKVLELLAGVLLAAAGIFIIYFNRKVRTLNEAKFYAYFYTTLLLAVLVRVGVAYADNPLVTSSIFVFTLFLVSMTIPWTPLEIVPIWLMHIGAFTVSFILVKVITGAEGNLFGIRQYLDGLLFLTMAFWLCLTVRRKETDRDIENFVLFKEVEDKNEQMKRELEWATRIHKTIISGSVSMDVVDIAVNYLPAYYIGGDYARFNLSNHDRLIFIISDVTGHGVPAALLVNRIHAEFERLAKEGREPGSLLKELNAFIEEDFQGADMYLSAFCGLLDFRKMRLLYSSYGHPPQYVYSGEESRIYRLSSQTSLLGISADDKGVYQSDIGVGAKDKILLFTDGIIEAVDAGGREYGSARLEAFLKRNHGLPPETFNQKLLDELNAFKKGKFRDDICVMSIGIKGHSSLFPWVHRGACILTDVGK